MVAQFCGFGYNTSLDGGMNMKERKNAVIRDTFVATLPVMAGYIVLGIGFGMMLKAKGYGFGWSLAMGVFIYAGSMQYLAVGLLSGGASLLTTALTTLAVNARHVFYGISMVEKYKRCRTKPFLIFTLTDETYSLVCDGAPEKHAQHAETYYFFVSLFDYAYWVCGCALGSLLGKILPFSTEGVDFALTALFLTVFVEQWMITRNHLPAVIGVAASLICLLIFGSDAFLIPAMIVIAILLTALKRRKRT